MMAGVANTCVADAVPVPPLVARGDSDAGARRTAGCRHWTVSRRASSCRSSSTPGAVEEMRDRLLLACSSRSHRVGATTGTRAPPCGATRVEHLAAGCWGRDAAPAARCASLHRDRRRAAGGEQRREQDDDRAPPAVGAEVHVALPLDNPLARTHTFRL